VLTQVYRRLRLPNLNQILFVLTLAWASMAGAPLRIEQVNELMHAMNRPKITRKAKIIPIDRWKMIA
jgi:hypothetical protein